MRYVSALILGGFQLMVACSSTQKLTQSPPPVIETEQIAEKQVDLAPAYIPNINSQDTVPPPVFKIDTLISIYYGPCYGKCEVYSLNITNDGLVYWNGYKNVTKTGHYLSKITVAQKEQLESWLADPGLWSLPRNFPEKSEFISDFPIKQYYLKYKGQTKQIDVNHSPSPLIDQLETNIQTWLYQADWRKIDDK